MKSRKVIRLILRLSIKTKKVKRKKWWIDVSVPRVSKVARIRIIASSLKAPCTVWTSDRAAESGPVSLDCIQGRKCRLCNFLTFPLVYRLHSHLKKQSQCASKGRVEEDCKLVNNGVKYCLKKRASNAFNTLVRGEEPWMLTHRHWSVCADIFTASRCIY